MPRKLIGVLQTSGKQGPPGPEGKPGPEGVAGKGFPVGGLANQILAKKSDADYDTEWIDNNAKGNVESVNGKTGKVTLTAEDVGATTEQWVNQQNYLKSIPSEYITETELDAKGYLTEHQDISNLATKAEVSEVENKIPTKVSQLENDKGYLTEHQDLTGYAKKTDIPDVSGFITEIPAEYVTDDELNAKGYLTEHQSLANYYTKPEVNELIPDLSGYALKTEIPTVPTNVSAFNNDVGYLTEIPSEYVTETELESKGYLTEHQSLANYSTTEEMNNAISNHHDSTKQDTLTAGDNITIENNVISATGGGGGSSLNIDNETIVQNEDGKISTVIGGKYVDGLVDGPIIVTAKTSSPSALTYDIAQELFAYNELWSSVTFNGIVYKHIVEKSQDGDNYVFVTTPFNDSRLATFTCTPTETTCAMTAHWMDYNVSFYAKVIDKIPEYIDSKFIPIGNGLKNESGLISLGLLTNESCSGLALNNNNGTAIGVNSFVVGESAYATNKNAISIGKNSISGSYAVAIYGNANYGNIAIGTLQYLAACNGQDSVAIGPGAVCGRSMYVGQKTTALGNNVISNSDCQTSLGSCNIADNSDAYVMIVGNSKNSDNRTNGLTVDWSGNGNFAGTVSSSTGADYAEYFEWKDGNTENEDRVGYIVTLDGDKIVKATSGDDILGICSGTAMVLGDSAEWNWAKRFLTDDFGRIIYEDIDVEHEAVLDEEGNVIEEAYVEHIHKPKENPNYDSSKPYERRSDRPEWQIVGMMGKLYVRDNGTCEVNGYATVDNGIAIKSTEKTNMRVMERVTENIVRVLLK